MIKLAVLDMAGTTINEDNVVYKVLRRTLEDYGFTFSLEEVLEDAAGKEKLQAIKDLLEQYSEDNEIIVMAIHRDFLLNLEEAYEKMEVKTFSGVLNTFDFFKRNSISIVLNTGYDKETATFLLEKLNWTIGEQIDGLVTASDVKNNRPAPDMIHLAMQKMNLADASRVLKVGDSIIDIEEGKNANCGLTFGVTTGAQTRIQLLSAQPDYILDSLSEIIDLLDK